MRRLQKITAKIGTIYRTSLFARCIQKLKKAYAGSVIVSFNTGGTLDGALGESALIKKDRPSRTWYGGKILSWCYDNAQKMLGVSFGWVALMLGFWLLSISASFYFDHRNVIALLPLFCGLLLFCFSGVRTSFRQVAANSLLGRFFELDGGAKAQTQNPFVWCVIGLSAVLPTLFLPLIWAVIVPMVVTSLFLITALKPIFFITVLMFWLPIGSTAQCIVLCLLLIFSHYCHRSLHGGKKTKADYIDILLGLFAVLCLLGSLFSFAPGDSFRVSAMWLALFSSVFIIYRHINNRQRLITVISALLIGSFFASCIGIWQYLSGQVDTTWTDTELFEELSIRVYSTFANPNVFGEFLLLVLPLSVGMGLYFKKWKYRICCFISAIVSFAALALTYSRGCYVGIAVTALIFVWMYSKKLFAALLVIGLPVGVAMMPQNMVNRIISIGNFSDSSTSYRLQIYEGTMNLLGLYWPSGLGIGETAFNYVYPFFGVQGVVAPHSHSLFFQLMISFGIAGFLYFLILLFVYHRNIISLAKTKKNGDRTLLIIFGSIFFGFLVQSIFDYTWYNYRVYAVFWMLLVMGFATYKFMKKENADD